MDLEINLLDATGRGFKSETLALSPAAGKVASECLNQIEAAIGRRIKIWIECQPGRNGACVGVHSPFGELGIVISVASFSRLKERADLFVPHELAHMAILAGGVKNIRQINDTAAEKNAAIIDIADHPYIWRLFQKYGVLWNTPTPEDIEEIFSDSNAVSRTALFRQEPHFSVKRYADYQFACPDFYQNLKTRLNTVAKGKRIINLLEEIETVRAEAGDIFTIDGVKQVRRRLIQKWQHQCLFVDHFAKPENAQT